MSTSEFDRAVNFLQGTLNLAAQEAAAESAAAKSVSEPIAPEPPPAEPSLPETPSEPPVATASESSPKAYRLVAALAIAAVFGVACGAAFKLIEPRIETVEIEKIVEVEPDGIPLVLLPKSADPALWDVVASMHGKIAGVEVAFHRGLAMTDSGTYKLALDFCRVGTDILAKVEGSKTYVVSLNEDGLILKAYPAPKSNKPLKELFKP